MAVEVPLTNGGGGGSTLNSAANLARDMREAGNFRESTSLLRVTLEQYQETLRNQGWLGLD